MVRSQDGIKSTPGRSNWIGTRPEAGVFVLARSDSFVEGLSAMTVTLSNDFREILTAMKKFGFASSDETYDTVVDVAPGLGSQLVLRWGGRPLLGVAVAEVASSDEIISSPLETEDGLLLPRWAANAAYNRHAPLVFVSRSEGTGTLLSTHAFRQHDTATNAGIDDVIPGSGAGDPFLIATTEGVTTHSDGWDATLARLAIQEWPTAQFLDHAARRAAENGFDQRGTVDTVLLNHLFTFRAQILRADEEDAIDRVERAHLDAMLVVLMARLLFIRHLEDYAHAGWSRGRLFNMVCDSGFTSESLGHTFAELHASFNSELFPSAKPEAYRLQAIRPSDLRRLVDGLYRSAKYGAVYDFRALEADSLGLLYQQFAGVRWPADKEGSQLRFLGKDGLVPDQIRRRFGVYYTPISLVDTLVDRTLGAWMRERNGNQTSVETQLGPYSGAPSSPIETTQLPRVLDIAVGSGIFLVRSYRYARRRLSESQLKEWLPSLCGADIDPRAITLARLNLWIDFARDNAAARLPSLARTIRVADSLRTGEARLTFTDPTGTEMSGLPIEWTNSGFDIIVGNPPFLSNREAVAAFGRATVDLWREQFHSATKEANIAGFFVERALTLLRPSGYLGLVLPRNLIKTEAGEGLRRTLRKTCDIVDVVDLLDAEAFSRVTAASVLIVARRKSTADFRADRRPKTRVIIIGGESRSSPYGTATALGDLLVEGRIRNPDILEYEADLEEEMRLLQSDEAALRGDPPWFLTSSRGREALRSLLTAGDAFGTYFESIYALDEGAKGTFLLSHAKSSNGTTIGWSAARQRGISVESRWVRNALHASAVGVLGRYRNSPFAVIYPYDEMTGEPLSLKQVQRSPKLWEHLEAVRQPLLARRGHGAGDGWWVPRAVRKNAPWHRPGISKGKMLVIKRHSALPQVTIVSGSVVPTGNLIAWIPKKTRNAKPPLSVHVAGALLSSTLWWWFIQSTGTVGSGKLFRITPSALSRLGVPEVLLGGNSVARALERLMRRAKEAQPVELSGLWADLDEYVFNAYSITREVRDEVENAARVFGLSEARRVAGSAGNAVSKRPTRLQESESFL